VAFAGVKEDTLGSGSFTGIYVRHNADIPHGSQHVLLYLNLIQKSNIM